MQLACRRDRTIALAAMLILLAQAFFTAWTTGAMASGAMPVDAWGNPLCVTSVEHGASDGGTFQIPGCCAMACAMSAAMLAQPAGAERSIRADLTGIRLPLVASTPFIDTSRDHDPGSPRAPPRKTA